MHTIIAFVALAVTAVDARGLRARARAPGADQGPTCLQKDAIAGAIAKAVTTKSTQTKPLITAGCPATHFIDPIRYRSDLGGLLNSLSLTGVGVEVGVQTGNFSTTILSEWKKAALFIQVDLWKPQENYKDVANVNLDRQIALMSQACTQGHAMEEKGFVKSLVQCRDFSTECAKLIPDDSLDFVYVDARHDRLGVLDDLAAFWPKMREGGVMAGHDYTVQNEPDGAESPAKNGQDWTVNFDGTKDETGRVTRGAVNDFFSGVASSSPPELKTCPRQVVVTYREQKWNTWVVRK